MNYSSFIQRFVRLGLYTERMTTQAISRESHEAIYLHAWNLVTHASYATLKKLYERYGGFEKAWHAMPPSQLDPLAEWKKFQSQYPEMTLMTYDDPAYPMLLKQLKKAPFSLYIQGEHGPHCADESEMAHTNLSIVGTRRPSPYGILQTQKIVQELSLYPIVIVSGLAKGVDTLAHETALLEGLPTWAIIGHGHDYLPEQQHDLVKQILKNGCIMSEYPPGTPPEKFRYPERNRIIAGLSGITVVTEAPQSSGANITAKLAREEDREVFALCADIDRRACQGNLDLIEQQIAAPLTSCKLLVEALGCKTTREHSERGRPSPSPSLTLRDPIMQSIVSILNYKNTTTFGEILDSTGIKNVGELLEKLTMLEIDGMVSMVGGGYILTTDR